MQDMEKRLNARITAQSLMIEALLDAAVQAGQVDARALVERLERFIESPKARFLDPVEVEEVKNEAEAWADMIYERYRPASVIDPARSRR